LILEVGPTDCESNQKKGNEMNKYSFVFGRNYVVTREQGDIPGCVPAVDVLVEHSQEEVGEHLLASADHYCNAIRHFIAGGFSGTGYERLRAMYEEANNFKKLEFIKNPAPKKDNT